MADEKPKIIVDSDWKTQAQAEKDRLAAEEAKKAASKPPVAKGGPAGGAGGRGAPREMPPADFQGLLGTMVTQALMYMGGFPDPRTGRAIVAPDYARYYIDLISVLEAKTKGNLSPEESKELAQVLHELRMRYVEVSKAIEEMAREEAAAAAAGGTAAPGGVALNPGAVNLGQPMGPGNGGPGKLVY